MGGVVTVAVRFRDGTVRCQEAWTGSTPFWLQTPQVLEADEEYLRGFLDSPDRKFVEPMPVAPTEYGLVVVDCMTRTLVEMSDYVALAYFPYILIKNEILRGYGEQERYDAVMGFLARGRLRHRLGFMDCKSRGRTWTEPGVPLDAHTLVPLLSSYDRCYRASWGVTDPIPDLELAVDWSPWDFRSFKWRGIGRVDAPPAEGREILRGLGFDVSHADWEHLDADGHRMRAYWDDEDDTEDGGSDGDEGWSWADYSGLDAADPLADLDDPADLPSRHEETERGGR